MTFLDKVWSDRLYKFQFYTYIVGIYTLITLSIVLFLFFLFNWKTSNTIENIFSTLNLIIGIYCSLYILWRYNTISEWLGITSDPVQFTRLDRMITLHAGILLFGLVVWTTIQAKILNGMKKQQEKQSSMQAMINTFF